MNPHPQNTQSVEDVVKSIMNDPTIAGIYSTEDVDERELESFLRKALTTTIESERARILKLLPPEKSANGYAVENLIDIGYNDYRRKVLQIINPKE